MEFPSFDHLRFYEDVHDVPLNISFSNVKAFTLGEFHRSLPNDLDLNWTDERGPPELRKLIARRSRVSPDHVLVTTGATEANFLANAALVGPGDRVVVDSPNYSPLRDCAAGFGGRIIPVARDCKEGWPQLSVNPRTAGVFLSHRRCARVSWAEAKSRHGDCWQAPTDHTRQKHRA